MPSELSIIRTEADKRFYQDLLEYLPSVETKRKRIVGFVLSDGTHRFSTSDLVDVLLDIGTESIFSERLWVIVSVAYLEDQLRTLLEKFLADDAVSSDLLDPNKGTISSLVPMSNVAFSLGLIAQDWHEILKRMAQLRNKLAHIPSARSFKDLINIDPKTLGLLDSLKSRYTQLTNQQDNQDKFQDLYQSYSFLCIHSYSFP